MAKWQDTFEQLKKRKKEMDQTSNTSERNQVNESYQPTVSRVQNSPTVSTRNFSALPTINTTSITNTILGINNNNTLPMYLPNITSNQFNAVKMPETTKTETNKTVKPTVETPTKTTQPVVNAEGYKETGKTYGDYWYQEYATRKDDKIYEKDGKYFLYDSKSGKYQDVDTVSYMTTKDDPSYKEAKKLGYKGSKSTLAHTSDKLKLDTSDLTKKEYKEYQSDLKRQQDKSDKELSRKSRINYGGAGLKGSLGVLKQYAQNLGDTVDDNVITPAKHIGDNYEVGKLNNELALEYYKKMEGKSNKVDKLEKKINTYNKFNQDLLEDPGALGTAIQQANTQVESIKNQGIAATVLGTVGAGIGFAIGGPSGAVAGAKIGGGAGYTVGATPYTYKLEAGNQYQALTEMGVPDKVAKKYSKITGGINATIESGENLIDLATLGLTKLTGKGASTVSKQAVKEMVDDYGEDTVRKWLTDKIGEKATNTLLLAGKSYVQNIGSEALEESTQEATSIATERLATKEAGIKREATGKDDVERILDAGKTAAISTAFTAPLTSFGGSIATNTINRVEKKVNNKINNKAQNKTNTITDTELNNEIANEIEIAMKNSNEKLTVEEVQQIQAQVQQQLIDDGIEISNTTTQETNSNLATEVESNTQYIDNNSNIWYNNNAEEGLYGNQQTNQNITNTTAYENQNELNRGTTNTENVEKNRINEGTVRSTTSSIRINEYKTDNGNIITYGETSPSKSFKDTYNIVKESKSSNPYGAFVDLHEESEYGKMKNFTLSDGSGNISITEDGNIVSVVKNPNSNIKGASKQLLLTALKNGGNKLDNYDGFLTDNYIKAGFEPVARVKFDPEYAPDGWNFERDGQPDIIVMKHNGDSAETVEKNYGKYDYDVDNLPYMDYDDAIAYRDRLIEESKTSQNKENETQTGLQSDTQTTNSEQEKSSSQSQENGTPTQQELDNLEDIRKNKSGSEYASAYYDLEKKYGKANLIKGLNEYKSTGKALTNEQVVEQVSEQVIEQVEDAIAPIKKTINELQDTLSEVKKVAEETKALTEQDLPMVEKQASDNLRSITDNDIAPVNTEQIAEGTYTEVESPLTNRDIDIDEVGKRSVKAYQYEHPEVKPYFQEEARNMLNDLQNSIKGERGFNDRLYYDSGGEQGFYGVSRQTTDDIADLLDNYNYSYADIEKGLKAIIEDNGKENIAVAKRIEFALDERLRLGYKDAQGYNIPPNGNYINFLRGQEWENYYNSIPVNDIAPYENDTNTVLNETTQDSMIAPVRENVSKNTVKNKYEAIEPNNINENKYEDTPMIRVKPDREAFEKAVMESAKEVEKELGYSPKNPTKESSYDLTDTSENQKIAEILTEEPKVAKKKQRLWATMKANLLDKGAVFEDLSIKTKNRDLMGKWDYTLTSEARAQNVIGNGHIEYDASTKTTKQISKSLNDIVAEVENTGLKGEFYDYMYHKHNIDRMNLEQRAREKMFDLNKVLEETTNEADKTEIKKQIKALEKTTNKPVFGDSITSEVSQRIVDQYENENPVFMDYAQDVYDYVNADRQQLVKEGVISQETADLWNEMYPHYVPIRREDANGNNIDIPLDTRRTGVNAPIKKATGGSSNILPLFDTMAMRTLQTYKAVAKNNFGVELKNALNSVLETNQTNVDDVINNVDNQESLLQEGKNGSNPTFTVFENGEKITYEITQDMYDALKPISESSILSKTFKPLNVASSFHRGVLTEYNPVFMLTNSVKDIQDVLINSQHTAKTYAKIPEAYAQILKKGYWYQEYISNGGEQNSYFDSQENTFKTENKGIKKLLDLPPLSTISKLNNIIEMAPRLSEYIVSREQGRSTEVSMLDAARITTNFKAGGNITKWANRNGATFLNASVQGAMQQVRNIREAKMNGLRGWANLATKFAIAGLPAILLNSFVWGDDDDYGELSDYVKQNYYVVWKKDDGTFIRIPKGRTVAVIQEAIQQADDVRTGNDEADLKGFLDLVLTNLAPNNPIDNNILSPITQVMNNKTWYGEDLVPTRLQNLPAKEQYDESTDTFSKWLGDKINVSPVKINYLLNQYSGGIGDVVLPMITPKATNKAESVGDYFLAPFKDKFTTDAVMNNKNPGELFETSEKLTKEANKSNATDEDVLKNKYINYIKKQMNDLYKEKREIQNSDLSKGEKYKQVREVQEKINAIAKEGMSKYKDGNYTDNYGIIDDKEYYLNSKGDWTAVKEDEAKELNSMDMSLQDKSTYFNAKNEISKIVKDYKKDRADLNEEYEDDEDSLKEVMDSLSSEKKSSIINAITDTGLSDEQQAYLYKKYYNTDTIDTILDSDIGVSTYFDYVQQEFKSDYNSKGKAISGSRKNKVVSYVNEYDLSVAQKAILIKATNTFKFNDYNNEIVDYVSSLDIPYEDKVYIFKELDMTIDDEGYVHW